MKQAFDVTGMTCSACSAHVEKSVKKLEGVETVSVSLLQNSMQVIYDEKKLQSEEIIKAVESGGYHAAVKGNKNTSQRTKAASGENKMEQEMRSMRHRLILSVCFLLPLMYLSMGHMLGLPVPSIFHGEQNALTFAFTQLLLTLPVMYVNRKYYTVGFKTLFKGAPNMDSLIAIGSSAAVIYGIAAIYGIGYGLGHGDMELVNRLTMDLYFESAAMILTLITLGKYFETKSKGKTSAAITKLMDLAPQKATVLRDGEEMEVDIEEVRVGDTIIVKSGQSIPVDGIVREGAAVVDESVLTGESLPVDKKIGERVTGGTVCRTGYFRFEATKVGEDTALAQIVRLVEEAGSSKAPIAKLADRVSGIFVPVVISIAVLATVVWLLLGHTVGFALSIGIAVLVISCPCALGLATPTAIMVGTGKGAENGILVKSAESLEILHTVQTVVLDKTGTVTEGRPSVTDVIPANGIHEEELLGIAASVEKLSEHPLAKAIVDKAEEQKILLQTVTHFTALEGQGITAELAGKKILAGNLKMMRSYQVDLENLEQMGEHVAQMGKTPLYFSMDEKILGMIAVADVVKETSRQAIEEFQQMGLEVVMLTGDNRRTAEAIRQQMGISRVVAEVLPQDKEKEIRRLQAEGKKVAMIGDGINDAPALARADVGIAIGAGTDIAIESADVVLMKSDLLDGVAAIQLSKAVIRNIKQNLFWAFFYNSIGIPLAAGVFYPLLGWKLNPMFGAAAMSFSSVCVVSNALRLKLFRPKFKRNVDTKLPAGPEIKTQEVMNMMEKTIAIEGMMCGHCTARVEKALNELEGVTATVDLEKKCADVTLSKEVSDEALTKAITDAGYEVTGIKG